ncbi:hypothetical protein Q1695_009779 [Nippostrongylus brasiliensis]|nr:hypothetical protein Q1695_009779 [Nippostrongylus brasiliensis]
MKFGTWSFIVVYILLHTISASSDSSKSSSSSEENSTRNKLKTDAVNQTNGTDKSKDKLDNNAVDGQAKPLVQPPPKDEGAKKNDSSPVVPPPPAPAPVAPSPPEKQDGTPRAPNFTAGSFFIGVAVALVVVGVAFVGVRWWTHTRGNPRPYTVY